MVLLWKFALSKFSPLSLSKRRRKLGVRKEELGGFREHELSLIIRKRLKGMKLMIHLWRFAFDENLAR